MYQEGRSHHPSTWAVSRDINNRSPLNVLSNLSPKLGDFFYLSPKLGQNCLFHFCPNLGHKCNILFLGHIYS